MRSRKPDEVIILVMWKSIGFAFAWSNVIDECDIGVSKIGQGSRHFINRLNRCNKIWHNFLDIYHIEGYNKTNE